MRVAPRGKFRTLVLDDGTPISASLDSTVVADPFERGGKVYIRVSVDNGHRPLFASVDSEIRRVQPDMKFTPLMHDKLFVKLGSGSHVIDPHVRAGDVVHLDLRLGAFGSFGYCWVASTAYKIDRK